MISGMGLTNLPICADLETRDFPGFPQVYVNLLKRIQRKATKILSGMEHLSNGDRLGELELSSLKKKRPQGDLRAPSHAERGYKRAGKEIWTRFWSNKKRRNGSKLKERKLDWIFVKHSFPGKQEAAAEEGDPCLQHGAIQECHCRKAI